MSGIQYILVAAEACRVEVKHRRMTRLTSILDFRFPIAGFQSEPPHVGCYDSKESARSAGFSPLQREMAGRRGVNFNAPEMRTVKRRERRAPGGTATNGGVEK